VISEADFQHMTVRTVGRLLENLGFEQVTVEDHYARYGRGHVFVEVTHDSRRSQELSIWIGDRYQRGPPFELADVLRSMGASDDDVNAVDLMQTSDAGVLERLLVRATDLMSGFGRPLLDGDELAFETVKRLRAARSAAFTRAGVTRSVVAEADEAWQAKDYGRVHQLLEPVRDDLDVIHRRRLEFATKRR
jgi:hypothetical protein